MTITRFSFPTTIHFGPGARKLVADHLRDAGFERPLIVTDKALAALPVLAEFHTHLAGLHVGQFDGVFCPNESSAVGMLRALEGAGLLAKKP